MRLNPFVFLLVFVAIFASVGAANCPTAITSSGTYIMSDDYVGAPNNVGTLSGTACVLIEANDVVFDCNGHTITNNGTADYTYGIIALNVRNVTIRNCPGVNNYSYGVYFYYLANSTLSNATAKYNTIGFLLNSGIGNNITKCKADQNSESGFFIDFEENVSITESVAGNNKQGFFEMFSSYVYMVNNTASNNKENGFYLDQILSYSNISNNIAYNNTLKGIYLVGSQNNSLMNNKMLSNGGVGLYLFYSHNNTVMNNVVSGGLGGIGLEQSSNCTITNNSVSDTLEFGFSIYAALSGTTQIVNNSAENSKVGLSIDNCANVNVYNFSTCNNTNYGVYVYADNDAALENVYVCNSTTGFYANAELVNNILSIAVTNLTIDSQVGGFTNYTRFNIQDDLQQGKYLNISWGQNNATLPPGLTPFAGKFTHISGNVTINKMEWLWYDDELTGYDEDSFELVSYGATGWLRVDASPDTANNRFTIYNFVPQSLYGIMNNSNIGSNSSLTTLYKANITNKTTLERWGGGGSADNLECEGGNVTKVELNTESLTDRWAAFYGNILGDIYLIDNVSGISSYLYHWAWTAADGGAVCASTNSSLLVVNVSGGKGSDVDNAWGFTGMTDSGSNTFKGLGCDIKLSAINITNAEYADTGSPGGFRTCTLKMTSIPAKDEMLFCTRINETGTAYNGDPANYELIVPTASGMNVLEVYYLYSAFD